MKIGILTHYKVNNLGAQLQMYAMYNMLKRIGHQPVVLTYNKNFDFDVAQKLRNEISVQSVPYIIREFLVKKGIRQTWHNTKKYLINHQFREKNFDFSFYATTPLDVVVIGADEVFSLQTGINIMMYGHGMLTNNCIAYAPSFGQTDLETIEYHNAKELIASGLKQFRAMSLRDEHSYNLVQQLTGMPASKVCDPVILYDFDEVHIPIRKICSEYIAIYSYDRNMVDEKEIRAIKAYAMVKGYKTVSIGNYHKWCDMNISCDCLEWLEYMRNAACVITDTFHGTVVATVLKKEIAVLVREINYNKLTSLVKDLHMESRVMSSLTREELMRVFSTETDYTIVTDSLCKLRETSVNYLLDAIDLCKVVK